MAAAGPSRSLYEALGLEPDAADAAVRGAYKKAAVKWHPDKHVGKPSAAEAEARFREVQAAYAVLSDPAKRKKYDARGLEGLDEADLKDIVVDPASITRMEALFLSLLGQAGVAVKTEVSRQVVEAAERGEIEMRSLIMGLPRADAVAKHKAHFYALDVAWGRNQRPLPGRRSTRGHVEASSRRRARTGDGVSSRRRRRYLDSAADGGKGGHDLLFRIRIRLAEENRR